MPDHVVALQANLSFNKHFPRSCLQFSLYSKCVSEIDEHIEWLKALRDDFRWSTNEVAQRAITEAREAGDGLTLSQQAVSNFENGRTKRVPHWLQYVRLAATKHQRELRRLAYDRPGRRVTYVLERHEADLIDDVRAAPPESFSVLSHILAAPRTFIAEQRGARLTDRERSLLESFARLDEINQISLLQIAETMAGQASPSARLHTSRSEYRAQSLADQSDAKGEA